MDTEQMEMKTEPKSEEVVKTHQNGQGDVLIPEPPQHTDQGLKTPQKSNVIVLERSYLEAQTIDARFRLANAFYKGGMVPKSYRNPSEVFAGLEFACELGLKPLVGLRNIAVINGHPSIWGDLPLALVQKSGLMEFHDEYLFDENLEKISFTNKNITKRAFGAVCFTRRKGSNQTCETWFTLDDAKKAGLLSRDNVWKTYERRMLQMRARSQNLKDNFADVLLGITIAEYDFNHMPDLRQERNVTKIHHNGTVARDVASELNSTVTQ